MVSFYCHHPRLDVLLLLLFQYPCSQFLQYIYCLPTPSLKFPLFLWTESSIMKLNPLVILLWLHLFIISNRRSLTWELDQGASVKKWCNRWYVTSRAFSAIWNRFFLSPSPNHPPKSCLNSLFSPWWVNRSSNDTIFQTMVPLLGQWFLSSASFNVKATRKLHCTPFYS
jgi:hypothetical protein